MFSKSNVSTDVTIKGNAIPANPCIYKIALRNRDGIAYSPETGFTQRTLRHNAKSVNYQSKTIHWIGLNLIKAN